MQVCWLDFPVERLCYLTLAEELILLMKAAKLLQLSAHEVEAGLKGPLSTDAKRE